MAYGTDAARWRALATRDANANGHFVYTVKSTNIYCRPTCPARLARRANIGFCKTAFEAEDNGFRACKRCKPNSILEDPQAMAVEKACKLIDEALKSDDCKPLKLQHLAKSVGLTPRYFHKIFKDKTGVTPNEWSKRRVTSQSTSDATPSLTTSPLSDQDLDSLDWNAFGYNGFDNQVHFDMDVGATLGYNLATGADLPVSMGHGNAISLSILDELWTSEYMEAGEFSREENFAPLISDSRGAAPKLPVVEKQVAAASAFELDLDALLRCDAVFF